MESPLCERSQTTIPGLLRRIHILDEVEALAMNMELKKRKYDKPSCVKLGILFFFYYTVCCDLRVVNVWKWMRIESLLCNESGIFLYDIFYVMAYKTIWYESLKSYIDTRFDNSILAIFDFNRCKLTAKDDGLHFDPLFRILEMQNVFLEVCMSKFICCEVRRYKLYLTL